MRPFNDMVGVTKDELKADDKVLCFRLNKKNILLVDVMSGITLIDFIKM